MTEPMRPTSIAVLGKAPIPGFAKTRLIPRLGAAGAARLQERLLEQAVRTAVAAGLGPVTLWCLPDGGHPVFAALARDLGVALQPQRGPDLGARMAHAVAAHTVHGPVLVIGTDCPALGPAHLRAAAAALAGGDAAVLIPAEDGGYVLIGLAASCPTLFDGVPWGTDRVAAVTRRRLEALGLRWSEPARLWDVDRPKDLDRLAHLGRVPPETEPTG